MNRLVLFFIFVTINHANSLVGVNLLVPNRHLFPVHKTGHTSDLKTSFQQFPVKTPVVQQLSFTPFKQTSVGSFQAPAPLHVPIPIEQTSVVLEQAPASYHVPTLIGQTLGIPEQTPTLLNVSTSVRQTPNISKQTPASLHVPTLVKQTVGVPEQTPISYHVPTLVGQTSGILVHAPVEQFPVGLEQAPTPVEQTFVGPTSFSCKGRRFGYFADTAQDCKVYHVCNPLFGLSNNLEGTHFTFNCPATTQFDQRYHTCVSEALALDCSQSALYFPQTETKFLA